MKITVSIDVQDDGLRHHTYEFTEDQEPFSLAPDPDDTRPDRTIEAIRKASIRRVGEALQRLLRQAET